MLYGLSYLGQPPSFPSFETKDKFLQNYVSCLFSALSSLIQQGLLAQTPPLEFPVLTPTGRLHSDPELEWREAQAIFGGTLSGATHY
jgi:hypothetical protein